MIEVDLWQTALLKDIEFEDRYPGVQIVRLPQLEREKFYVAPPPEHKSWCELSDSNDWATYEEVCSCNYEERRQEYAVKYRHPKAKELPRAILLNTRNACDKQV